LLRALEWELGTMLKACCACRIADLRVKTTDLVGLLVGVEVLHFERCGRV
jgi:hypothetical protein